MRLTEAIRTHALAEAQAGNFNAVATKLRTVIETAVPRECGSVETADALIAVGANPMADLDAMRGDATGQFLLTKLAGPGVSWGHRLTVPYLAGLVAAGKILQKSMDALVQLSAPTTHPFASVTAADCSAAWLVNADCLLSINRTDGVLRVCLHVYRNGQQVRLAVINEGEGSEADRALTNSIEAALDRWLQAGG